MIFEYFKTITTIITLEHNRSELENTKLKQYLFFDFIETYNYFKENLCTYRILIIPENIIHLSVSCQKYPSYNKEKFESLLLLNIIKPPNSSSTESTISRIRSTEPLIQLPSLLPSINLPLRKFSLLKPDNKFIDPLYKTPFKSNIITQEFFIWFIRVFSQSVIIISNILQFCFKDAIPVIEYKIYQENER
ncbi:hypothetical protein EAF04_000348 [Stromatinia cepivora]|nr:hypothetical protein EAF04_000348 [Stromatinia cepivora]